LVHFNREEIEQQYKHVKEEVTNMVDNKCEELRSELRDYVNEKVNRFSRIQVVNTMKRRVYKKQLLKR